MFVNAIPVSSSTALCNCTLLVGNGRHTLAELVMVVFVYGALYLEERLWQKDCPRNQALSVSLLSHLPSSSSQNVPSVCTS